MLTLRFTTKTLDFFQFFENAIAYVAVVQAEHSKLFEFFYRSVVYRVVAVESEFVALLYCCLLFLWRIMLHLLSHLVHENR